MEADPCGGCKRALQRAQEPAVAPALPGFCSFLASPPSLVVSFLPFWVSQNNNDQIYPVKSSFASQRHQSASQQWKVKFRFQFLLWLNSESLTLVETRKQEAWFLWNCISDSRVVAEEKSPSRPQSFFLILLSSVFNETLRFPGKLKSWRASYCYWNYKMITACWYKTNPPRKTNSCPNICCCPYSGTLNAPQQLSSSSQMELCFELMQLMSVMKTIMCDLAVTWPFYTWDTWNGRERSTVSQKRVKQND